MSGTINKQYIEEEQLLNDSFRLAAQIYESGFRPNFIVGIWRGGSAVGIYVQECLQYLGVETDHIAIRTSYRGMQSYMDSLSAPETIRVHGLQYLYEQLNRDDRLLLVDDVFSTGHNMEAVLGRLKAKCKRNYPDDVRIAVPFFRPVTGGSGRVPDYFLHKTNDWLVLPYELQGLSQTEISENKPWVTDLLETT